MTLSPRKTWRFLPEDPRRERELASELRISTILARCLLNRSITDPQRARDHLQPELGQLVDPSRFSAMEAAVARVQRAVERRERILIHGDYDVDGVSGTALLLELFRLLRADVVYHIPNRLRDGYSFGEASLERIRREKANLVVTVDNGITAVREIASLREQGVDVVITDHHLPSASESLPPAVAIINPNLPDSGYPHGTLCGVAVAFKLAWGVAQSLSPNRRASPEMKQFLLDAMGWVAIGTISDIVPLVGENRVFAKFGLAALQRSKRPGIQALLQSAGVDRKGPSSEDVAFRLGPRINAAGRLGAAEKAVEMLTTSSRDRAVALVNELETNNEERRSIQNRIHREARERLEGWDFERHPVIVLADERWHAGVIGIVCAKLVEEFHAPAILIALEGEQGRGSGRAMRGFALHEMLSTCAPLLLRFGGHAQAAGLEIRRDRVEAFCERLNEAARERISSGLPGPSLPIDAEISLPSVTNAFLDEVDRLAPYGPGNEVPVFATRAVQLAAPPRRVGRFEEHLQFQVKQGTAILKAIGFGLGPRAEEIARSGSLAIAYSPKVDRWGGRQGVQLEVVDFLAED